MKFINSPAPIFAINGPMTIIFDDAESWWIFQQILAIRLTFREKVKNVMVQRNIYKVQCACKITSLDDHFSTNFFGHNF